MSKRPSVAQRLDKIEELLRFVLETPREVQRQTIWPGRRTPKKLAERMRLWHESGEQGESPAQLVAECGTCGTLFTGKVLGQHLICVCSSPERNLCETFLRAIVRVP